MSTDNLYFRTWSSAAYMRFVDESAALHKALESSDSSDAMKQLIELRLLLIDPLIAGYDKIALQHLEQATHTEEQ